MKYIATAVIAAAVVLGASAVAQAQSVAPQIPTPVNPAPLNPVATDGTPLAYADVPAEGVVAGRRAASPLDGFVGIVPNTIDRAFVR